MVTLIDGKKLAGEISEQLGNQIVDEHLEPQLAIILVGHDPASELYVKLKRKKCEEIGVIMHLYRIDETVSEKNLHDTIRFLNADDQIDSILIQLPLPKKFNQSKAIDLLDYRKDVDGFHPRNVKAYLSDKPQHILPGLALAVWNLIASTGEKHYLDKKALIIARSENFSLPTKKLLAENGMETSIIRPDDASLAKHVLRADIVISVIGKPNSITADMIKPGATVIDVGINKVGEKIVGDVDFENVSKKAAFITPVPGGVGPMTIATLLFNAVVLARERKQRRS